MSAEPNRSLERHSCRCRCIRWFLALTDCKLGHRSRLKGEPWNVVPPAVYLQVSLASQKIPRLPKNIPTARGIVRQISVLSTGITDAEGHIEAAAGRQLNR